ncbi:MAG: ferritin-like domain-containing protein [Alphaproteobacteria bacterium]|nr:ferritin-like domain-containing protein [Alphaproteobacteria bacterium]
MEPAIPAVTAANIPAELRPAKRHWALDDIPWDAVRRDLVAGHEALFYMLAAASLMESATDLYTANLIEYFADDDEIASWLRDFWLPEELQHGRGLRRYVETAWPDFPWAEVREAFVEEFRPFCDEALEEERGLEMASRCVVETGTASFYTCLSRASPDPVLALLTRRIAEDEIRHYKHFYRFFRKYREIECSGRAAVAPALWRRVRMTGGEDRLIVLKHVHAAYRPGAPLDSRSYRRVHRQCRALMRPHFPARMTARMLLKPLGLGPRTQRLTVPVLAAVTRCVVP